MGKAYVSQCGASIGSRIPVLGKYFNIGPVPMSGGATTVKQTTRKLGPFPSAWMLAGLGNWDDSLLELPIGESGHFASSHYKDEWDAYYAGRSFPMQFGKVDAKSTVVFDAPRNERLLKKRPRSRHRDQRGGRRCSADRDHKGSIARRNLRNHDVGLIEAHHRVGVKPR